MVDGLSECSSECVQDSCHASTTVEAATVNLMLSCSVLLPPSVATYHPHHRLPNTAHNNTRELEQQLLQIQEGTVPRGFMQLEEDYNTRRMRQQEGAVEAAVDASSSSAAQPQQQQAQAAGASAQRQPSSAAAAAPSASTSTEPELVQSDLDIPVLSWLGISFLVPKEGKVRGWGRFVLFGVCGPWLCSSQMTVFCR